MSNNFNDRVETYTNALKNMLNKKFDYKVYVRELDKAMQLGLDTYYSKEQRASLVKTLVSLVNKGMPDDNYKALTLAYASKINKISELDVEVPKLDLEDTLIIDSEWRELPASLVKDMSEKEKDTIESYKKSSKIDEDILCDYNISLAVWHFKFYQISTCLR